MSFIKTVASPLVILGAGGKVGPTLAVLARRAASAARSSAGGDRGKPLQGPHGAPAWLEAHGVKTIACDLLDAGTVRQLPMPTPPLLRGTQIRDCPGPGGNMGHEHHRPPRVLERYPQARIAALSTGNVYPLAEAGKGGALETSPLTPCGEYANAAVGRERIFEFCSRAQRHPG